MKALPTYSFKHQTLMQGICDLGSRPKRFPHATYCVERKLGAVGATLCSWSTLILFSRAHKHHLWKDRTCIGQLHKTYIIHFCACLKPCYWSHKVGTLYKYESEDWRTFLCCIWAHTAGWDFQVVVVGFTAPLTLAPVYDHCYTPVRCRAVLSKDENLVIKLKHLLSSLLCGADNFLEIQYSRGSKYPSIRGIVEIQCHTKDGLLLRLHFNMSPKWIHYWSKIASLIQNSQVNIINIPIK